LQFGLALQRYSLHSFIYFTLFIIYDFISFCTGTGNFYLSPADIEKSHSKKNHLISCHNYLTKIKKNLKIILFARPGIKYNYLEKQKKSFYWLVPAHKL